uniref:Divalent cation tolerance protein n=1 Tax=Candidatus Kentrum eta TaxID=2126337 RepID=A0A450V8W4_9GAMM|nr:MAG: divalent cation tolerance protein [Candidatus Kentron sp. H]VFJ94679.1 MAG: divalent cation tolerance protein [Candidatus Kentron sp. H]VFK01200.1 MAG: divalent cation tolerance protein [Candidatus Kentron sp. H]
MTGWFSLRIFGKNSKCGRQKYTNAFIHLRVSAPNLQVARDIAEELVAKRLAAAVHVTGPSRTTYWWQDEIHNEVEWLCEARTSESLKDRAIAVIREIHPYEVPEIFSQVFQSATPEYAAWLIQYATGEETSS